MMRRVNSCTKVESILGNTAMEGLNVIEEGPGLGARMATLYGSVTQFILRYSSSLILAHSRKRRNCQCIAAEDHDHKILGFLHRRCDLRFQTDYEQYVLSCRFSCNRLCYSIEFIPSQYHISYQPFRAFRMALLDTTQISYQTCSLGRLSCSCRRTSQFWATRSTMGIWNRR